MKKGFLLVLFLGLVVPTAFVDASPSDCFYWARNYTDLSPLSYDKDSERLAVELCRGAQDEAPAKCYKFAREQTAESKQNAVNLCQPALCPQ